MAKNYQSISMFEGKKIASMDEEKERMYFEDGSYISFFHERDCCETCKTIKFNNWKGEARELDLKEIEITEEELEKYKKLFELESYRGGDLSSGTITLLKINDWVICKWIVISNGYYNESISFEYHKYQVKKLSDIIGSTINNYFYYDKENRYKTDSVVIFDPLQLEDYYLIWDNPCQLELSLGYDFYLIFYGTKGTELLFLKPIKGVISSIELIENNQSETTLTINNNIIAKWNTTASELNYDKAINWILLEISPYHYY